MITLADTQPDFPAVAALRAEIAAAQRRADSASLAASLFPTTTNLCDLDRALGYQRGLERALRIVTSGGSNG